MFVGLVLHMHLLEFQSCITNWEVYPASVLVSFLPLRIIHTVVIPPRLFTCRTIHPRIIFLSGLFNPRLLTPILFTPNHLGWISMGFIFWERPLSRELFFHSYMGFHSTRYLGFFFSILLIEQEVFIFSPYNRNPWWTGHDALRRFISQSVPKIQIWNFSTFWSSVLQFLHQILEQKFHWFLIFAICFLHFCV